MQSDSLNPLNFRGRTYAAFLFDIDGTMLDSSAVVERVWRTWANRHGIDADELMDSVHGVRAEDTVKRFAAADVDALAEAAWLLEAEMSDTDGIVPIAGISSLVVELDPAKWAVVTSAPRRLATLRLESIGLDLPRTLIAAEDVQRGKPDPEGFLTAAATLGVPIGDCLIFEDSLAGVAAAQAAGASVVIVGDRVVPTAGAFRIKDYR